MSTGGKPLNPSQPWVLILEFPSHADATTAKELISETFGTLLGEFTLRPKRYHPSHGNIANWRSTAIVRKALSNRTFGIEEITQVLVAEGYLTADYRTWLTAACKAGVLERVARGEYRFPPAIRQPMATPNEGPPNEGIGALSEAARDSPTSQPIDQNH